MQLYDESALLQFMHWYYKISNEVGAGETSRPGGDIFYIWVILH